MKDEFVEYLKSIGITTGEYLKRIENIMEVFSELHKADIVDIFVDEYIKEDGTREYEGLTLFSDKYVLGALRFFTEDNFVVSDIRKKVTSMNIKEKDYDFKKATEKSRLNVDVYYEMTEFQGNFKASKENCDFLKQIILKYYIPNIKE